MTEERTDTPDRRDTGGSGGRGRMRGGWEEEWNGEAGALSLGGRKGQDEQYTCAPEEDPHTSCQ